MQNRSEQNVKIHNELQTFVDDNCGCSAISHSDPVSEACADAALMLQQQTVN